MVVKASMFFRSFLVKKDKDGKDYLQVKFLDEDDNKYTINFPYNEENKKYMKMQKDTRVEISFNLYQPTRVEQRKYNLFVR